MNRRTATLIALLLLAGATAAAAGTFTVTLTNGTSFDTRYRPVEAEWDDSIVLIHTDRGNPIALQKGEIADVTSSVEESGFGYQVDTTTLFVGWSPLEAAEEEGEDAGRGGLGQTPQPPPQPTFTIQQFVNPESTSTAPLPIYTGYGPQQGQ
jgi:hypothetical protein